MQLFNALESLGNMEGTEAQLNTTAELLGSVMAMMTGTQLVAFINQQAVRDIIKEQQERHDS